MYMHMYMYMYRLLFVYKIYILGEFGPSGMRVFLWRGFWGCGPGLPDGAPGGSLPKKESRPGFAPKKNEKARVRLPKKDKLEGPPQ